MLCNSVGSVEACVEAFNIAYICGLQSVEVTCNVCGKPHFDCANFGNFRELQNCVFCNSSFGNTDFGCNFVGNPIARVCDDVCVSNG